MLLLLAEGLRRKPAAKHDPAAPAAVAAKEHVEDVFGRDLLLVPRVVLRAGCMRSGSDAASGARTLLRAKAVVVRSLLGVAQDAEGRADACTDEGAARGCPLAVPLSDLLTLEDLL